MTGSRESGVGSREPDAVAAAFDRLGPWVTRFTIGGREYGGSYRAAEDRRIEWFHERFPGARDVLELGSLEGGHSFALAALPQTRRVVAVEGRARSLERARYVQSAIGDTRVQFVHANLERADLASLGTFDAALCLGILYHLPAPWLLVDRLAAVAPGVLIWTHYAEPGRAGTVRGGYRGRIYREWRFLFEPLSGLSFSSFWPSRDELIRMVREHGFPEIDIIDDDPGHPHGPAVVLAAAR